MGLPVVPPLSPMLARLTRELPVEDGFIYEPKWDGFRCIAFRDGDSVDLRSRNQRPLARYFPELTGAVRKLPAQRIVIDGEIVIFGEDSFDFAALMSRLHPAASRVERLSHETPACFIAFDLIATDDDVRDVAFERRRDLLLGLLADAPDHVVATAATDDEGLARRWLAASSGTGVDGVMAKHRELRYQPGRRTMVKVKPDRTADCVVAGFRVVAHEDLVASLLLGLYGPDGRLRHVGVTASFTDARRRELYDELMPRAIELAGHPWERGFGLGRSPIGRLGGAAARWTPELPQDWVAVAPELVAEVGFDHWDGERFRHPTRFRHFRWDRHASSCTFGQLEVGSRFDLGRFLASG